MNIEKIEIQTGQYVWVDKDAEIKQGDLCYDTTTDNGVYSTVLRTAPDSYWNKQKLPKIIAASPELELENVPTYVEYLSDEWVKGFGGISNQKNSFIKGYREAQKKLFTEEDVRKALWELGDVLFNNNQNGIKEGEPEKYFDKIIEQLKKEKIKNL